MNKPRHKTSKEENFPVGMLIKKSYRPLVDAYYKAARLADDIADNDKMTTAEKLARLDEIEKAFRNQNKTPEASSQNENSHTAVAEDLGKLFKIENLDPSLYLDLLTAFRRDAKNEKMAVWEQLVDYCNYSAVPVGRFMLALHNESPSAYLPAAILCTVLQIVNHLQDLKYDAMTLQRFYLPQDLMQKHGVAYSDIYLTSSTVPLQNLLKEITDKLKEMLNEARILPFLIRSLRLRMELGVILSLTNSMIKKIERFDVLNTDIRLSKTDWLKAFIKGSAAIFSRTKNKNLGTDK